MKKNLMVCGFESGIMPKVLLQLHKDKAINITKWLYDGNVSDKLVSNLEYSKERTTLWRGDWQVKACCPDVVGKAVAANMDWLMQEFARDTEFYREPFYEYKNIIHHIARELYVELCDGNVDCVLFPDIPHGDIYSILYVVARAVAIKTIYFVPSYNTLGKFMYAQTIEQYGEYKGLPVYEPSRGKIHIDEQYEKKLFYMKEEQIKQARGEDWKKKLELFSKPSVWLNKKTKVIKKTTGKYDGIADYSERKLVRAISELGRSIRAKNNLRDILMRNVDMEKKYVYFPLHLQPEMTVDTIGGVYRDQLLAVEQVRCLIPNDWYIYVKENPKQLLNNTRGKYFFRRLKSIDKVCFVDRHVNTYDLLRNSQFVATVTGTVGWEAISGGKPVLTFGECWYRQLPGVVRYHQGLKLQEIINCKWSHEELEREYATFVATMCDGAWLENVIVNMENFNEIENKIQLYNSIKFIFAAML
ncbi:capsular polysaccharide export protein, LipB/KpsS family [Selenomonas ruminantium]|uniref:Capsule polysaccharide biosynthesis protein n=1 Tax=Selenomonas ruminantium TaxID=971 RepID=A0A1K1NQI1_SELRU|nr:hypothetical protein [Selenomonas ruminantium]SFW37499.1 Capsule polysaccharide biosynthesis protein [Selenomonas ruminantium]